MKILVAGQGIEPDEEIYNRLCEEVDDPKLLKEALQIRSLLQNMARIVEPGTTWYLIAMSWMKKWQSYVYFDKI